MTDKAGQPGAPGSKAPAAGQAPNAATKAGDVGGKPEPQGYYAYVKVADGEIRLSGGHVNDKIIELKGKGVLAYVSQNGKGWAASVAINNRTYDLIGKPKTAASGVEYVFFWNPKDRNFMPKLSLFRADYRRG